MAIGRLARLARQEYEKKPKKSLPLWQQRQAAGISKEEVRALRAKLGDSTKDFGARFARGHRIVEDWEQGRRTPDPFVARAMRKLLDARKGKVA